MHHNCHQMNTTRWRTHEMVHWIDIIKKIKYKQKKPVYYLIDEKLIHDLYLHILDVTEEIFLTNHSTLSITNSTKFDEPFLKQKP